MCACGWVKQEWVGSLRLRRGDDKKWCTNCPHLVAVLHAFAQFGVNLFLCFKSTVYVKPWSPLPICRERNVDT